VYQGRAVEEVSNANKPIRLFGDVATPSGQTDESESQQVRRPAADPADDESGEEAQIISKSSQSVLRAWSIRDFMPLMTVIGIIIMAALLLKRFMPGRGLLTGAGTMEVVARTALSAKQHLVLVKIGRRLVLLGVTPEHIETLSVVDDPEEMAILLGKISSERPDSMSKAFAESFAEEAGAYSISSASPDSLPSSGSHVRGLLEKVRRLSSSRVA